MAPAAAFEGNTIKHDPGLAGYIAGAVAGAAIAVAVVSTGGAALIAIGAAGAVAGGVIGNVVASLTLPGIPTGSLIPGNSNVLIHKFPAIKMGDPVGPCWVPVIFPHGETFVVEGSSKVFINSNPASRVEDELLCGAFIAEGSPSVFFGGPKARIKGTEKSMLGFILERVGWTVTAVQLVFMPWSTAGSLLGVGIVQSNYEVHSFLSDNVASFFGVDPVWGQFAVDFFAGFAGGWAGGKLGGLLSRSGREWTLLGQRAKNAAWSRYEGDWSYERWSVAYDHLNKVRPLPTQIQNIEEAVFGALEKNSTVISQVSTAIEDVRNNPLNDYSNNATSNDWYVIEE